MHFDTKIAIVLDDELAVWQKANVSAANAEASLSGATCPAAARSCSQSGRNTALHSSAEFQRYASLFFRMAATPPASKVGFRGVYGARHVFGPRACAREDRFYGATTVTSVT